MGGSRPATSTCSDKDPGSRSDHNLALRFKALGHPVRLEILKKLSSCDSACCGDLVGCLVQAQSTVSQHLQVLKDAGLVDCRADGRKSCYRLNRSNFEKMQEDCTNLLQHLCCETSAVCQAPDLRKNSVEQRKKENT